MRVPSHWPVWQIRSYFRPLFGQTATASLSPILHQPCREGGSGCHVAVNGPRLLPCNNMAIMYRSGCATAFHTFNARRPLKSMPPASFSSKATAIWMTSRLRCLLRRNLYYFNFSIELACGAPDAARRIFLFMQPQVRFRYGARLSWLMPRERRRHSMYDGGNITDFSWPHALHAVA